MIDVISLIGSVFDYNKIKSDTLYTKIDSQYIILFD